MRRIFNHTGNKSPVITNTIMLRSETRTDKEYFDIISNDIGHSDPFQIGTFGWSLEVDISLSQIMIESENIVDNPLVTTCIFYKQALPLF